MSERPSLAKNLVENSNQLKSGTPGIGRLTQQLKWGSRHFIRKGRFLEEVDNYESSRIEEGVKKEGEERGDYYLPN